MNRESVRSTSLRKMPAALADLIAVVALVALADLSVFLSIGDGSFIRTVLGLAFVLILPGYALVAALFPETRPSPTASGAGRGRSNDRGGSFLDRSSAQEYRGIDGVERVALSFGLSIAIVPLLLVGVALSPLDFALIPTLASISVFTVGSCVVAAVRRAAVPEHARFYVPYREWFASGTAAVTDADSQVDAVLNVALAVAIVFAVGTLTFTVVAAPDGERYTEFYVLMDDDGDRVAADYPEIFSPGEPTRLNVGIENYERRTVTYSTVIQLQRVEGSASGSVVTGRAEVDRVSTTLAHNETSVRSHNLTVPDEFTGEDLRLAFLLYEDAVPDTPTPGTADYTLHLWIDVEPEAE